MVDLGEAVDVAVGRCGTGARQVVLRLVGDAGVDGAKQSAGVEPLGGCRASGQRRSSTSASSGRSAGGRCRAGVLCRRGAESSASHAAGYAGPGRARPAVTSAMSVTVVRAAARRARQRSRTDDGMVAADPIGPPRRMRTMARRHDDPRPPARGPRRAHRRRRRRDRDAGLVPRVRVLGHLLARPARRARRPQAGAAPHPLPDDRDGPAPRSRPREVARASSAR